MKKLFLFFTIAIALTACTNDDRYTWEDDFADLTATDTVRIAIAWAGSSASVTGDDKGFVTVNGAHVTVRSSTNKFLKLSLSGSTTDGSLLIYSWKMLGVELNGVSITNQNGPAINNQCSKAFVVTCAAGTTNTLADGTTYSAAPVTVNGDTIDQKGTLFSEGQIYFRGNGTLNIRAAAKNGIASDDYIVFEGGTVNVNVAATGTNGIKVNDGFTMKGGNLNIDVMADGARGIKCDARTTIQGGLTTITTSGDCKIEMMNGISDTTSAAGIKSDSLFVMTGGTLNITSTGDGGKGINCSENVEFRGGTLQVNTTGSNDVGKPKGIKSDTGIIVSGGSFNVTVKKSWACDNGNESEDPDDRVTVLGTPLTKTLLKRSVTIKY
jgi:hypothetical protein